MTITTSPARDEYTANAGQTVFDYTFKVYANDELTVYVTPSGLPPNDSTDLTTSYTVDPSTIGDEDGGFITFGSPLNAGDLVTIISGIPYDRTVDYQNNGDFRPETVNGDNDRQVSQIKQLVELTGRTLQFQNSAQNQTSLSLPDPAAGLFMRWKGDLSGLENIALLDSPVIASNQLVIFTTVATMVASAESFLLPGLNIITLGYYVTGDGGGASYIVGSPQPADELGSHTLASSNVALIQNSGEIPVRAYGAKGDGIADDQPSFTAADAQGSTLIAEGDYKLSGDFTAANQARFLTGAIMSPDVATTSTFNGSIEAPTSQIFGGAGDVAGLQVSKAQWFGAVADGVADDAAAIQSAVNAVALNGVVTGSGGTFRADSTITLKGRMTLIDFPLIDFSSAPTADKLFEADGSLGATIALTSDAPAGDSIISVGDVTGISRGVYLFISSASTWSAADGTKFGEYIRVKSVAGLLITLDSPVSYSYLMASTGVIQILTPLERLTLRNISAIGSGPGGEQYGADLGFCDGLTIKDCQFSDFDDRNIQVRQSVNTMIENVDAGNAERTGLAYGVAIVNGCSWANVDNCRFRNVRHGVTIGGLTGVNKYITVSNSHAMGVIEAGFDCHPAGDYIKFVNNCVEVDDELNVDGIIVQGGNCHILGNSVKGARRNGIVYQNLTSVGPVTPIICDNDIDAGPNEGTTGITCVAQGTAQLTNVKICNNAARNYVESAVLLRTLSAKVEGFNLTGNGGHDLESKRIIFLDAASGFPINFGTICNNSGRVAAADGEGIFIFADVAGEASFIAVNGNVIFAGTYGVRGVNTNRIMVDSNVFTSQSISAITVAGAQSVVGDNVTV